MEKKWGQAMLPLPINVLTKDWTVSHGKPETKTQQLLKWFIAKKLQPMPKKTFTAKILKGCRSNRSLSVFFRLNWSLLRSVVWKILMDENRKNMLQIKQLQLVVVVAQVVEWCHSVQAGRVWILGWIWAFSVQNCYLSILALRQAFSE